MCYPAVKFLVDDLHLAVNDKHQAGRTPLHISALKGHSHVCEFLLQREAEIDGLDDDSHTPFLCATQSGHVDVLKLLIKWKCDTAARNKVGCCLHLICLQLIL
jgi:ankyrin repeat protein